MGGVVLVIASHLAGNGLVLVTLGLAGAPQPGGPFTNFPVTATQTTFNGQGKIEVRFAPTNGATIFRLEAR